MVDILYPIFVIYYTSKLKKLDYEYQNLLHLPLIVS